jgi:endonuclease/exonuclease/phosphatase family metal-dependent hydrolase
MRRLLTIAGLALTALSAAQLRVATWNITTYSGGRQADLSTAIFNTYQGRSMRPDIIATQEFLSQAAQDSFLAMLNAGPLGPIWQAAPFTNGPDMDHAFFYRSDRVILVDSQIISQGGNAPLPPRDTKRFDVVLLGYGYLSPKLAIYSAHMKAGTTADDRARRLAEATAIRQNLASLSGFDGALVVGDFNVYTSEEEAFIKLTGSEPDNSGRVFDPINSPGDWNDNAAFRFIHTQDPATSSGMDSRFDFILVNSPLLNGAGFDYIGQPTVPFSGTTWNDPNHSYRVWGNDGSSFNNPLNIITNSMVGPTIAQALVNSATVNGGHLPVFLDLKVPAEIGVDTTSLNFGTVVQGASATRPITVANETDTFLWSSGVATLLYQLSTTAGFSAPSGVFADEAGGSGNVHQIALDTSTTGVKNGTLYVTTLGEPPHQRAISLTGQVVPDILRPDAWSLPTGKVASGNLASVWASDDLRLTIASDSRTRSADVAVAIFEHTSPVPGIATASVIIESSANKPLTEYMDAFDFGAGAYVNVGQRFISQPDTTQGFSLSTPNRFIQSGTGKMRIRLRYRTSNTAGAASPTAVGIDALGIELR